MHKPKKTKIIESLNINKHGWGQHRPVLWEWDEG